MKKLLLLTLCGCGMSVTETSNTPCPEQPVQQVQETQEGQIPEYNRKDWKHWIDLDKDCQDARQEVLIAESTKPVVYKSEENCHVLEGSWTCPYTGNTYTDPSDLDVDHMVALKDAHESGGWQWDRELKKMFANDLENEHHLIAVSKSANRSKGSKGPDEWLPTNEAYRCEYVRQWFGVKETYDLDMEDAERAVVFYILRLCDAGITPPLPQN